MSLSSRLNHLNGCPTFEILAVFSVNVLLGMKFIDWHIKEIFLMKRKTFHSVRSWSWFFQELLAPFHYWICDRLKRLKKFHKSRLWSAWWERTQLQTIGVRCGLLNVEKKLDENRETKYTQTKFTRFVSYWNSWRKAKHSSTITPNEFLKEVNHPAQEHENLQN